ncbi:type II secretion system minor pseudopilin GspH [Litoribacillus peritrichatus]|uniref:Type II secretion system protein H n=1 Tax=Litoribacillus peritrichatus TaxID=718191 RepID=A0ABP7MGG6_9GAMM
MLQKQRGFTLIELLVVMVLIGALFGTVTISMGTRNVKRDLVEEGQRLQALFQEASQQAILYNQEVGWYFKEGEYGFLSFGYEANTWSAMSQRMFRPRETLFEFELIELDGTPISERLDDVYKDSNKPEDSDKTTPTIVFLSSGESSSFELSLFEKEEPDWLVRLKSDGFAAPELELPYDEDE